MAASTRTSSRNIPEPQIDEDEREKEIGSLGKDLRGTRQPTDFEYDVLKCFSEIRELPGKLLRPSKKLLGGIFIRVDKGGERRGLSSDLDRPCPRHDEPLRPRRLFCDSESY